MGNVRRWAFEAVIRCGGSGLEPKRWGIARKLTWIGIGPHRSVVQGLRGPVVTFDHFLYLGGRFKPDTRGFGEPIPWGESLAYGAP